MHIPVGIKSLAVSFPSVIRTNDYYREKYPNLVAKSEEKTLARLMSLVNVTPSNEFELEMQPYLKDPFRGTVQRRVLGEGESSLTLEYKAAKDALDAANFSPDDIDLIIGSSFLSEHLGLGNAAFIARELDLTCAAWNLDATCCSTPIALQTASALVQSGAYHNVLVVVSCTYSRLVDKDDTLSWFFGDGAGAFVISSLSAHQGILGTKAINTSCLCDQLRLRVTEDEQGNQKFRLKVAKDLNKIIGDTSADMVRICCEGAAAAAAVTLDDIDFFVFTTATAWFVDFCIRVLNIDPKRTINFYPEYANVGAVLSLANLYHAAQLGKIRENDLVLIYGFGSASSASASVMRWGDVALGKAPVNTLELVY
ncbi:3-oxoacyl-ACP synthase III family protein [Calothrix sp. PCC 6303]|uniref:3-oxoacyl-ACP synthase III family protein n=1 Tax=Calothrix sp. PCC 6303 TaxID=1170562 RepID=UPI0002A04A9E|nr:3-oxoacyl-[acyl-carrier-protein] synthase III C-terminal domain-containing protein [Calothrix sp. PCC 6303]AFZ02306.1 Beta-ketoacyl-acyl-carrier-protein synthase III [Calothrix sp. PCC 6303]